LAYMDLGK